MSDLAIPLEGIRRAESQIDISAKRLSRLPADQTKVTAGSGESGGDVVDLSTETVALMQSKRVAEANMKALQSMDEVQKRLIDILA